MHTKNSKCLESKPVSLESTELRWWQLHFHVHKCSHKIPLDEEYSEVSGFNYSTQMYQHYNPKSRHKGSLEIEEQIFFWLASIVPLKIRLLCFLNVQTPKIKT